MQAPDEPGVAVPVPLVALFPGHVQILSRSREEISTNLWDSASVTSNTVQAKHLACAHTSACDR